MAYRLEELRAKSPKATLQYQWVPYERISNNLKKAMVAAEDAKFVDHEGFDWDGIQNALEKNQKKGRVVAGGSTITQQLAKNLFLTPSRSYLRKAEEAVITLMLEAILPKRRILEIYLNVIEWGNGVFGAEAAARRYFGVSAAAAHAGAGRTARGDGAQPALLRAQPGRARARQEGSHHPGADAVRRSCRRIAARFAARRHLVLRTFMSETVEEQAKERPEAGERVQDALAEITALLRKHRLVEGLVQEQLEHAPVVEGGNRGELVESLVTRQNKAQLQRKLDRLHPADIAYILEALPLDERLYIWDLVKADRDGEILLEVSEPVRESLISSMDTEELVAAAETLDAEEIAELAPDLPQEVMDDVFSSLPVEEREQLRAAMSFEDDMVGALMDFEDLQVRPDVTLEVVLRYLRRFEELPSQTDQLFVVDRDERLLGVLPVNKLIVSDPETAGRRRHAARRSSSSCSTRRRTTRPPRSSATTSSRRRWSTPTTSSSAA